jgi:hypothetical protein
MAVVARFYPHESDTFVDDTLNEAPDSPTIIRKLTRERNIGSVNLKQSIVAAFTKRRQ